MKLRPEDAFEQLDPPPGGLARLRRRLDRPARGSPWPLVASAGLAAAAVAFALVVVPARGSRVADELREAMAPRTAVSVEGGEAVAVGSSGGVSLDLVATH